MHVGEVGSRSWIISETVTERIEAIRSIRVVASRRTRRSRRVDIRPSADGTVHVHRGRSVRMSAGRCPSNCRRWHSARTTTSRRDGRYRQRAITLIAKSFLIAFAFPITFLGDRSR